MWRRNTPERWGVAQALSIGSMSEPFSLSGRVVLVTGGSRGIGAAIATASGAAGADVAVGYRDNSAAAAAVVSGLEAMGRTAMAVQADVSDPAQAQRLVGEVEDHFGHIDGLVNNAGVMPSSPSLEMSDEEWDLVLRTNLYAPFYCSRAVLSGMVDRGRGSIVMISSRLGQIGWPQLAHYSAAVKINPNFVDAHYNMAVLLDQRGSKDKAIKAYQRVLQLNPNHKDAQKSLSTLQK